MDTNEMRALLHARFPAGEYAVLEEVRNTTGFGASRSADALVMSLWPSRGLELWGVEIKVSRADWLRERKNPKKAEEIAARCDRWYVAVPDAAVVADELPTGWGLMVPKGAKLTIAKEAEKIVPSPIDRGFLAAVLRRAQETSASVQEIRKAVAEAQRLSREQHTRIAEREKRDLAELQAAVAKFEEASGVSIVRYDAGRIGAAVRAILWRQHVDPRASLEHIRHVAQTVADSIEKEIAALAAERVA